MLIAYTQNAKKETQKCAYTGIGTLEGRRGGSLSLLSTLFRAAGGSIPTIRSRTSQEIAYCVIHASDELLLERDLQSTFQSGNLLLGISLQRADFRRLRRQDLVVYVESVTCVQS